MLNAHMLKMPTRDIFLSSHLMLYISKSNNVIQNLISYFEIRKKNICVF